MKTQELNDLIEDTIFDIMNTPRFSINLEGELNTSSGFKHTPTQDEAKTIINAVFQLLSTYTQNDIDKYGLGPTGIVIAIGTLDDNDETIRDHSMFILGSKQTRNYLITKLREL